MRYKVAGVFLIIIFGVNLYAIISDIKHQKNQEPLYYYGLILAALALGIYFLFLRKKN